MSTARVVFVWPRTVDIHETTVGELKLLDSLGRRACDRRNQENPAHLPAVAPSAGKSRSLAGGGALGNVADVLVDDREQQRIRIRFAVLGDGFTRLQSSLARI